MTQETEDYPLVVKEHFRQPRTNKAQCRKCGDIIESVHRHDYVKCSCGAIAVDGGRDYLRRTGSLKDVIELSEWE